MKLGFTGTRHGMDPDQKAEVFKLLEECVDLADAYGQEIEVHHGDCVGADEEFHYMAAGFGKFIHQIVKHPPKDTKLRAYCRGGIELPPQDYAVRNFNIVMVADKVLAAPPTEQPQPR